MLISRVSDFHDGCPKLVVLVEAGLKCRRGESDCVCMCEREANELHPCWKLISPFIHRACLSEWLWRRNPRLRCISSYPTTNKQTRSHAHQQAGLSNRRRAKLLESYKVHECVSCSESQYFTGFTLLPTLHHKRGGIIMTTQADTVQTHALYSTIRS